LIAHNKLHTRVTPGNWTCVRAEDSPCEICYKTNTCDICEKPHMRGILEREHLWLPITCLDIKFEAIHTVVTYEKRIICDIWDSPRVRNLKMYDSREIACVWYVRDCMCKTYDKQLTSNIWKPEHVLCLRNCIWFNSDRQTSLQIVKKVIKPGWPNFFVGTCPNILQIPKK